MPSELPELATEGGRQGPRGEPGETSIIGSPAGGAHVALGNLVGDRSGVLQRRDPVDSAAQRVLAALALSQDRFQHPGLLREAILQVLLVDPFPEVVIGEGLGGRFRAAG